MESSWYLLHIKPKSPKKEEETTPETMDPEKAENTSAKEVADKQKAVNLSIPQVGTPLVHFLGRGESDLKKKSDEDNPLWDKIQDEVRPAWAPDFLRLGYAVVFRREGLPKLAVKLGLKNPANLTEEEVSRSHKRILTFDDVWVCGCSPHRNPMYFPDKDLKPEEWWLATKERGSAISPYLAPGGVTVTVGVQRLSDVIITMLQTPQGFPRPIKDLEDDDDMSEFINPLIPLRPVGPVQDGPTSTNYGSGDPHDTGYGWAGMELFRYAGR